MSIWTTGEVRILKALYPARPRADVCGALSRHTWDAIVVRAHDLGIKRPRPLQAPLHPIIAKLVTKRNRLRQPQDRVADAIGINRATLSRFERGRAFPNFVDFNAWCEVLGFAVSISDARSPSADRTMMAPTESTDANPS